jgi:hypothetical protein
MIEVELEYDDETEVWNMIRWCKQEFPKKEKMKRSIYPWEVVQTIETVVFSFENNSDALMFKLVWG